MISQRVICAPLIAREVDCAWAITGAAPVESKRKTYLINRPEAVASLLTFTALDLTLKGHIQY